MRIPIDILTNPGAAPATLATTIDLVIADIDKRTAVVADLEERLSLEVACSRLGMRSNAKVLREQLDTESTNLVTVRRSLTGLRAIEAARNEMGVLPTSDAEERGRMQSKALRSRGMGA